MIRINLLSDREAVRKETSRQQVSIFVLSVSLLVVVLLLLQVRLHVKKKGLEDDIREVNKVLKTLEKQVGIVNEYKKSKKELETKLQVIKKLQTGQLWVPLMLDCLGETMPEKMWLDKLGLRGTRLSMEGYAIDHQTIANFMKDLEATPFFPNVELELTEKRTVAGVSMKYFSIVTGVEPSAAVLADMKGVGLQAPREMKRSQ